MDDGRDANDRLQEILETVILAGWAALSVAEIFFGFIFYSLLLVVGILGLLFELAWILFIVAIVGAVIYSTL